ncbi:hypothetical protein R1flu_015174 [Riccia fluitans]|uniref:Uncharacterized protein n=1 Tax=Riccia fluitans TaxID=41844 RepID=A0ABD1YIJ7_9MARC
MRTFMSLRIYLQTQNDAAVTKEAHRLREINLDADVIPTEVTAVKLNKDQIPTEATAIAQETYGLIEVKRERDLEDISGMKSARFVMRYHRSIHKGVGANDMPKWARDLLDLINLQNSRLKEIELKRHSSRFLKFKFQSDRVVLIT